MVRRFARLIAPAKVNLFLAVGERLDSGYHRLDTVFHAIELHDDIVITEAEELSLACTPSLDLPAEQNLAIRAARAFGDALGRELKVRIELVKRIPEQAGLGGGSSDAAAVLAGLARLWGVERLDSRCLDVAASIGADVPFFLHEGPVLMTGRGDVAVQHLHALDAPVVVVRPPVPVSTAAAYRAFDRSPVEAADIQPVVSALESGDPRALGAALFNNLAPIAVSLAPEVGEVLDTVLASRGVLGATVAGSGSAVFGVVENEEMAQDVVERAQVRGWWAILTRLRPRGVEVVDEEGTG